jgi:CheY-like chemotaxis protein
MNAWNRSLLSILVVDDHETGRYATSRALRALGYKTMETASGSEALEFAEYVAAVVLDIQLPDLLGFEVCRLLRRDPRTSSLPIVHVTAVHRSEADYFESVKSGADAFFTRPVDPVELVAVLDKLIAN